MSSLIDSKIINPFTLEFRDKKNEAEYYQSFSQDYIRNTRFVISIVAGLDFLANFSRFSNFQIDLIYTSSFQIFIFAIFMILFSYFDIFKKVITPTIFLSNLVLSYLAINEVVYKNGSTLEVLQIIVCFTVFPRSYFKYSILANTFILVFYTILDSYMGNPYSSIEVFLFFNITIFLEIASYLKERFNRIDYLKNKKIAEQEEKSNRLLLNILPTKIANELIMTGEVSPVFYESASILFSDFKGFTSIAEKMAPKELVKELDGYFFQFDEIVKRYNLEKLKTIGDSYMCAGGIPMQNSTHAIDTCLAALEILKFMKQMKEIKLSIGLSTWDLRLGIHTGSVVGGVIGKTKFAYDIWGDTVNIASRMESSGEISKINISEVTYQLIKEFFECEYRGEIDAKNKGKVKMYFLKSIKLELSVDGLGIVPNDKFNLIYASL